MILKFSRPCPLRTLTRSYGQNNLKNEFSGSEDPTIDILEAMLSNIEVFRSLPSVDPYWQGLWSK